MILETLVVGALSVNCYLIGCEQTHEAAVIDPGDNAARIKAALDGKALKLAYILLTHGHCDHFGAARDLQEKTGAKVLLGEKDAFLLKDIAAQAAFFNMPPVPAPQQVGFVKEGDVLSVGRLKLRIIETPGHSPGGLSIYLAEEGVVFTGDTLFWGAIGRTDLPGADQRLILESLKKKLGALPDATQVYPGHFDETSIGFEKEQNPFFE